MKRRPLEGRYARRRLKRRFRRKRREIDRRTALGAVGGIALGAAVAAALLMTVLRSPNEHGARVIRFTVDSRLVDQDLTQTLVVPPGSTGAGRPLLIFLGGKGQDESSNLTEAMFAALAREGRRAPDILFPDGGGKAYWHNRESGAWGSYVTREVLPRAIAKLHADGRRLAIGGVSSGGFGAFDIARLKPHRFCAVGGDSPALWLEGSEAPAGAFESAEDFAHHNVVGAAVKNAHPYPGAKLWLDVGSDDRFRAADTTFVEVLRAKGKRVQFHLWEGSEEGSYSERRWARNLRFYARALAGCKRAGAPKRRR